MKIKLHNSRYTLTDHPASSFGVLTDGEGGVFMPRDEIAQPDNPAVKMFFERPITAGHIVSAHSADYEGEEKEFMRRYLSQDPKGEYCTKTYVDRDGEKIMLDDNDTNRV